MSICKHFAKGALFALFAVSFFPSCGCRIPTWYYESDCYGTAYAYSKLVYSDTNSCKNLELEIIYTSGQMLMYINILSIPLKDVLCVECRVDLTNKTTIEFDALGLEGGQRFLIPEEVQDQILDHLWVGGIVDISIGRYRGQIAACDFKKAYRNMLF